MKTLKTCFSLSAILIFVLFSNSYIFASPDTIDPAQPQASAITQTGQPAAQELFTPVPGKDFIEQYKMKSLEALDVNGFTGNGPELFAGKPDSCVIQCRKDNLGEPVDAYYCLLECYLASQ